MPMGSTEQIFRFLFCEEEKRRMYDIQEKRLLSYIGELLGSRIADATLASWDQPGGSGCLGNEVTTLLQQRSSVSSYRGHEILFLIFERRSMKILGAN